MFSDCFFSSSPNIPENLVQFCCVFWKPDHVIEFLFHSNGVKESCNFENVLYAKCSNFTSTQKKYSKYSGMLGGDEKLSKKYLVKKF